MGKLITAGYTQSLIDECVIYIGSKVKTLQQMGLDIEDWGNLSENVGVNIKHFKDGSYEFKQQALIEAIVDDVGIWHPHSRSNILP
ncbi:hypothetical protein ACHAXS_000645 [Conticribra weissflogii]